jgi:hypothetical protein
MRTEIVRELLLRRRRARVPWVYVVYHRGAPEAARDGSCNRAAAAQQQGAAGAAEEQGAEGATAGSVLPAKKRGHVERRRQIAVEDEAVPLPFVT